MTMSLERRLKQMEGVVAAVETERRNEEPLWYDDAPHALADYYVALLEEASGDVGLIWRTRPAVHDIAHKIAIEREFPEFDLPFPELQEFVLVSAARRWVNAVVAPDDHFSRRHLATINAEAAFVGMGPFDHEYQYLNWTIHTPQPFLTAWRAVGLRDPEMLSVGQVYDAEIRFLDAVE